MQNQSVRTIIGEGLEWPHGWNDRRTGMTAGWNEQRAAMTSEFEWPQSWSEHRPDMLVWG